MPRFLPGESHLHRRTGGCHFEGVRQEVVEDLAESFLNAASAAGVAFYLQAHRALIRERCPHRNPLTHLGVDVNGDDREVPRVEAAEGEKAVDDAREPQCLVARSPQVLGIRMGGVEGVEPQTQRCQRGAELVRSIGDQSALGPHQHLQSPGHRVEALGHRTKLGRPGVLIDRGGEVPFSDR